MFKSKIFKRYIITMLLISIIPIIVLYFSSFQIMSKSTTEQVEEGALNSLTKSEENISTIFSNVEAAASDIIAPTLSNTIALHDLYDLPYTEIKAMSGICNSVVLSNRYLESVYLYDLNSRYFIDTTGSTPWESFYDKDWLNMYYESIKNLDYMPPAWLESRAVYSPHSNQDGPGKYNAYSFILPYPVDNSEKVGLIVMNVNLSELFNDYLIRSTIILSDTENGADVIYGQEFTDEHLDAISKLSDESVKQVGNTVYIPHKSPKNDWLYISIADSNSLLAPIRNAVTLSYIIILAILICTVLISLSASWKLYKPIQSIVSSIKPNKRKYDDFELIKQSMLKNMQNKPLSQAREQISSNSMMRSLLRNEHPRYDKDDISCKFGEYTASLVVLFIQIISAAADEHSETGIDLYQYLQQKQYAPENCMLNLIDINRDRSCYIISFKDKDVPEQVNTVRMFAEKVIKDAENESISIILGIGNIVSEIERISESYLSAEEAYEYGLFTKRALTDCKDIPSGDQLPYQALSKVRDGLVVNIKARKLDQCEITLREFFSISTHNRPKEIIMCFKILNSILLSLPTELGYSADEIFYNNISSYNETFSNLVTIDDYYNYFMSLCKNVIQSLNIRVMNKNSDLINGIKQYIVENISQDVSLNNIADMYHISPPYLSTVFRQEAGETFLNYVTDVKIEYAKELLISTNLKIKDISVKLGYFNEHSFYNMFKKNTGYTPKEFRQINKTA